MKEKNFLIFSLYKNVQSSYWKEKIFFFGFFELWILTKEIKEKQKISESQIDASELALMDFPELRTNILKRKNQLLQDIEKLKAYTDFLTSLI